MSNTKVTQHVIANNAITADQLASAAVTDAKLHSTLDLSSKTLTLPATAIPSASTATTQSASDNSTKLATTAYVTTAIANLNDSAPTALNTLNELAAALGDDANFSATITTSLAAKAPLANPTFTGSISHGSNLTLDAVGGITLDADGGQVDFKDAGTLKALIDFTGNNVEIQSRVTDADLLLRGQDGSSFITALTLDMSEAGFATFNDGGAFGGTGALKIPVGTTGQRPSAATGQIRWNTTDGAIEVYNGTAWTAVGTGSSNKVLDTFTGDNSTTTFTLSVTPANEDAIMVFIDGAYQEKGDYVLTNNSLALGTAPLSGEKIAVHTTTATVHDGTTALNQQFTATAGQTDFTLSQDPKSENNTQVYINGVYQQKTDYTVTGTTLAFDTGLTVGDVVEVNMFTVATLGNTDTVNEGVSNLYHTTARARSAISVSGNALSYNSSTGVITSAYEESPTFTGNVNITGDLDVGAADSNNAVMKLSANTGNWVFTNVQSNRNLEISDSDGTGTVLTIDTSGNVGIGTDNPGARLELDNPSSFTNMIEYGNVTWNQNSGHGLVAVNRGSDGYVQLQLTSGVDNADVFTIRNSGTGANLQHNLLSNGNVYHAGNVGIGTTNTNSFKTYIDASSGKGLFVEAGDNGYTALGFDGDGLATKGSITSHDGKLYIGSENSSGTGSNGELKIIPGTGNVMMLDGANARVGIGTYTPDAKLHVYGTDPVIRVSDDGTHGFATLELRQQNTTSEGFEISYNSGTGHTHLNNVYSSGDTVFGTSTGSFGTLTTNVRMKITSNGHVSIPSQPHWFGSATNTSGAGMANAQTPHSSHSRNTINVTTVSGALRWIIPRTGVYVISFNTIADSGSARIDTNIYINGTVVSSQLSPSHASATNQYRQRSATVIVYVQESDYVQFYHQDWYNSSSNVFDLWRTISLTMVS